MIRLEEMQDAACAAGDHATIATIVSIIASFKFILVFARARVQVGTREIMRRDTVSVYT